MSGMKMNDDVETEEFIDELSDEALDRERAKFSFCVSVCVASKAPVTER